MEHDPEEFILPKNDDGEFELILGNRQLLSVFFVIVILLGVFFTMGYIVGRNSAPAGAEIIAQKPGSAPPVETPARPTEAPSAETPARVEPAPQAPVTTQPQKAEQDSEPEKPARAVAAAPAKAARA